MILEEREVRHLVQDLVTPLLSASISSWADGSLISPHEMPSLYWLISAAIEWELVLVCSD